MNKTFALNSLRFNYGQGFELKLDTMELEAREPILLDGDNGSGKTTLLKLLSGLLVPTTGTVTYNGVSVAALDRKRTRIIFVHQHPYLFRGSVRFNLRTAMRLSGLDQGERTEAEKAVVELFQLESLLARKHFELSSGEKQRVAIARAFAVKPEMILLDEPSTSMDWLSRSILMHALSEAAKSGIGMILTSHDVALRENLKSIRTIRLQNGTMAQ